MTQTLRTYLSWLFFIMYKFISITDHNNIFNVLSFSIIDLNKNNILLKLKFTIFFFFFIQSFIRNFNCMLQDKFCNAIIFFTMLGIWKLITSGVIHSMLTSYQLIDHFTPSCLNIQFKAKLFSENVYIIISSN